MPTRLLAAAALSLALSQGLLFAQFVGLTAPGNGDDLYFSIDLPLKGSGQPKQGRIFKVGATPVSLVAEVQALRFSTPSLVCGVLCTSNFYHLAAPQLSRDKTLLLYEARADCFGLCISPSQSILVGVPGKSPLTFDGPARLSGNGRFVAWYSAVRGPGPTGTNVRVTDLQTGLQPVDQFFNNEPVVGLGFNGRVIADDGTLVLITGPGILVYRKGQWIVGPSTLSPSNAVIDASGQTVLYQASPLGPQLSYGYLRYFHPDTREEGVFLQANGNVLAPSLTYDGRRVAFLSDANFDDPDRNPGLPQVYIVNIDLTGLRALSHDPYGVSQYVLSDDGQTAWYRSYTGAVYQVNTATGETRQRIPPFCDVSFDLHGTPGSAILAGGLCIPGDFNVRIDGVSAPVLAQAPLDLWVQVPWEVRVSASVPVEVDNSSPFNLDPVPLDVRAFSPRAVTQLIHEDFSAFVQPSNPAHMGEVLHFYSTGLGPVQPPVPTDVPGSANPLSRVVTPIDCNAPVVFAGLAPGLIGFYQVSIQITPDTAVSQRVECTGTNFNISVKP